jgi:hypothetical protein
MRLFVGIALCCLLAGSATAMGGGFHGGFRGGSGGGFRRGSRGFRGRFNRFGRFNQRFGNGYVGGGYLDSGWGSGASAADQAQAEPGVIVVAPPMPLEPPPPPVSAVVREYHWPNSDQVATSPVFSIVTNDRAIHYARMVWINGNLLRFTTRSGSTDQVLRSSISRELTYQANAGKNLTAWLP